MRKQISYWWLVPILGGGAALWWLAYGEAMTDPLLKYNLAHRLCIAAGLIVIVLGMFRQHGKPLRERLHGYYRFLLPAALFVIVIGANQHWFAWPYFATVTPRISPDGYILQSTGFSCSPAAMANLIRLYGQPAWEGELAITMRMPFTGSGMDEIGRGLAAHGFAYTDTETTLEGVRRNNRPCMTSIWLPGEIQHSCILLAMTDTHVWLLDPLRGERNLSLTDFARCWTGKAVFAAPPGAPPPYDFTRPFSLVVVPHWLSPLSRIPLQDSVSPTAPANH